MANFCYISMSAVNLWMWEDDAFALACTQTACTEVIPECNVDAEKWTSRV